MVKTKGRLRSKVWFPHLHDLVEQTVRECALCQSVGQVDLPAPINTEPIPHEHCYRVSADFVSLPGGKHVLVVVDDMSKYPEVEIVA